MRGRIPASPVSVSGAALSSMIDIIFQLIIFFVVTASFDAAQLDTKVELPTVSSGAAVKTLPPERLIVNVYADGSVKCGYQSIASVDAEAELAGVFARSGRKDGSVLVVNGDGAARHAMIAPVLRAAAAAGFSEVKINATVAEGETP